MAITRKTFGSGLAAGTVLLWLQACGGGGDEPGSTTLVTGAGTGAGNTPGIGGAPPPGPAVTSCVAAGADVAGNHGHVLIIPAADLDATVPMTFSIAGSAGHDHTVTFGPQQLAQLKAGQSVTVTSTTTTAPTAHQHAVTPHC